MLWFGASRPPFAGGALVCRYYGGGAGPLFQPSVDPPHDDLCRHTGAEECQCPIPYEERKASAFYRKYCQNPCYCFLEENGKAFFNQEIFKTLLLYGEMDTILRVCAIPDVGLRDWWEVGQCYDVVGITTLLVPHRCKPDIDKMTRSQEA